jgi:glycosyltransferase involved in cell wall biosynthesis
MRLAFAIPWHDTGRWLWQYLPTDQYAADLLLCAPPAGKKRLPAYIGELLTLWRSRPNLAQYDVVFAWELRCAVAVALLRKCLPVVRRPVFVPVGPILKGKLLHALPLLRWLLADADRVVCFSRIECDRYAELLRLPRERFLFLPTPWRGDEAISDTEGGYILALGQSNRDYATLLKAVAGTDLPVVIVAGDESALGGVVPTPNVTVKYRTGHEETERLIHEATLHCIPLHDTDFSAGQTVLLRAMACGKAVVVSDTAGVRDYVESGTAEKVPPGDSDALRVALTALWNDAPRRRAMGALAAQTVRSEFGFPRFAQRLAAIAEELDG